MNFDKRTTFTMEEVHYFVSRCVCVCVCVCMRVCVPMFIHVYMWFCMRGLSYYFDRFSSLLPYSSPRDANALEDEFLQYQLLDQSKIPEHVWQAALVQDEETTHYRLDVLWTY